MKLQTHLNICSGFDPLAGTTDRSMDAIQTVNTLTRSCFVGEVGELIAAAFLGCRGFRVSRCLPGDAADFIAQSGGVSLSVQVKAACALDQNRSYGNRKAVTRAGFTFTQFDFDLLVLVVFDYGNWFVECFEVSVVKQWPTTTASSSIKKAHLRRLFMYRSDWSKWPRATELEIFRPRAAAAKSSSESLFDGVTT